MVYFRVKPKFDNTPRMVWKRHKRAWFQDGCFVKNELYTQRELKPYTVILEDVFEVVRIPKNRVYWFFGARFEMTEPGENGND
jgi:hypothetical protein